jgi:hypothetical protein
MASRVRRLEVWLALCGLVGGFCVALTALIVDRHEFTGKSHGTALSLRPARVEAGPGSVSPAALDRQWLAYSDESTCADRSGGDGVSAARLSFSQIAWFFSDSFLGPAGPRIGFSRLSGFVHNLVVVETTSGEHSTFVTITGGRACAGPGQPGDARSVVSAADAGGPADRRYWVGDGLRIGSRLLRFYNAYLPGPVPYIPVGTVIASFPASQLARDGRGAAYGEVIRPRLTTVPAYVPPGGGTPIVWGAAVLRRGNTVYIYGWQSAHPNTAAQRGYLARAAASRLADIAAWRFYAGDGRWAAGQSAAQPITDVSGPNVDTGFSVISVAGHYWLIEQAGGLGSPDIDAYPAAAPWGPFDAAAGILLYRAPGIGLTAADGYRIMYAAQAEPAVSDKSTLVISYNVNSLAVTAGCVSLSSFTNAVIQPRFIAVPRSVFSATRHAIASRAVVSSAPAANPTTVSKHPTQWFESWAYPHDCPPVPAVRGIWVTHASGAVRVRWPASGIGVQYRVYLREPGRRYTLLQTVRTPEITLPHLTPGSKYQVLVVPQNARHGSGPGATVTVAVR